MSPRVVHQAGACRLSFLCCASGTLPLCVRLAVGQVRPPRLALGFQWFGLQDPRDRFLETPLLAEVDREVDREVGGFPGPRGCRVRHAELGSGL